MELIFYLLTPLLLTCLIEISVALYCQVRYIKDFAIVILAQLITNPLINLGALLIAIENSPYLYGIYLFIGETLVLIAETFIYKFFLFNKTINPFRLAAFGNITSFGLGVIYTLIYEFIK